MGRYRDPPRISSTNKPCCLGQSRFHQTPLWWGRRPVHSATTLSGTRQPPGLPAPVTGLCIGRVGLLSPLVAAPGALCPTGSQLSAGEAPHLHKAPCPAATPLYRDTSPAEPGSSSPRRTEGLVPGTPDSGRACVVRGQAVALRPGHQTIGPPWVAARQGLLWCCAVAPCLVLWEGPPDATSQEPKRSPEGPHVGLIH